MNKIIPKEDNIPESCNTSETILVLNNKPTVRDLRPIALTKHTTYKLFIEMI